MGRVRTKTVKKAARQIVEKYYDKLTLDFQVNKRIVDEAAQTPTKKIRNKIAGFVTHLMRRIQNGPVRGISLAMQEERRERRDNYIPEESALDPSLEKRVDKQTKEMLDQISLPLTGIQVITDQNS